MDVKKLQELFEVKLNTTDLGYYGILPVERSDEFIDLVVDESVLLKGVTTQRVSERAGEYVYFKIPNPVLAAAAEGQELTEDTGAIDVGKAFEYNCVKISTRLSMTWEMINWNLTGPEFEDWLVRQWAERMSQDVELLALTGTGTGTGFHAIDKGWLEIIKEANAHVINWVDSNGVPKPVDDKLFQQAYRTFIMEPLARILARNPVWMTNPVVYADFMAYLTSREDNLGAAAVMGATELTPVGISFFNGRPCIPYWPTEQITVGGNTYTVTSLLLGDPKLLWFIIHREFRMERVRRPEKDTWEWYGYGYIDFVVPFPSAFVLVKNIKIA